MRHAVSHFDKKCAVSRAAIYRLSKYEMTFSLSPDSGTFPVCTRTPHFLPPLKLGASLSGLGFICNISEGATLLCTAIPIRYPPSSIVCQMGSTTACVEYSHLNCTLHPSLTLGWCALAIREVIYDDVWGSSSLHGQCYTADARIKWYLDRIWTLLELSFFNSTMRSMRFQNGKKSLIRHN